MALTDFDLVCVTGSSLDADGFPTLTHDAEGDEPGGAQPPGAPPFEQHSWLGLWATPLDPVTDSGGQLDTSQSCTALKCMEGGKGHIWACEDPRVVSNLIPAPAPGETIVHNCFGAYSRYRADGSIFHATTTTGGGKDGTSIYSCVTPTGFVRASPFGTERFGSFGPWTGYSLNVLGGARMTLGSAGGVIPGMSSYVRFQSHMFEINASAIAIGPEGAPAAPVAKAMETVAVLGTLATALNALAVAMAGFTGTGTFPGLLAATSAIATAQSAVGTALQTISTQTAIG